VPVRFGTAAAHVAIEVGTHSPWVSRLLEECGHEVLVANPRKTRLIYGQRRKTDKLDALRSWPASLGPIPNFCTPWSTGARTPRLTWRWSIRARRWSVAVPR
jgi:transposase